MVINTVGHVSQCLEAEKNRSEKRLEICKKCPLFTNDPVRGYICDSMKYVDANGNPQSMPGNNAKSGCGCRLQSKTRIITESCVLGKW